ncbi:hypothetical protein [Mucilaginibacter jinjuensis]|uniref:Uncharacterized protein n=1 Tax=Mucilaginibacter jinjuensis TaxID=1176721 RepID=A0ABY7TBE1_9SPHI|nr:hypothetical protein [Mucilaginibacter jinjuensis]WCT13667.1 hypothetical protein PQO05_06925 [Mucilaginibacter jinjuensis]
MKKLLLAILPLFSMSYCYAQVTTDPNTGNVGIKVNNPTTALQIGPFQTSNSNQIIIPGTYNFEQVRFGQISNGNSALEFVNHTSYTNSYGIRFSIDIDHGAPGLNLQYAPSTSDYASLNYKTGLHLDLSGNIAIGTTLHPAGYKFAVAGSAIAESVTVQLQSEWPDFVFDKHYTLRSLTELKSFIDQNHHLPEMPAAKQVASEGINLGELGKVQTKKIEELTLYLIEKDEEVKKQQTQIDSQQQQINDLKAQVTALLKLSNTK